MVASANSKPCQTSEMEPFSQVATGFEANSELCQISEMKLFAKIVKN